MISGGSDSGQRFDDMISNNDSRVSRSSRPRRMSSLARMNSKLLLVREKTISEERRPV